MYLKKKQKKKSAPGEISLRGEFHFFTCNMPLNQEFYYGVLMGIKDKWICRTLYYFIDNSFLSLIAFSSSRVLNYKKIR